MEQKMSADDSRGEMSMLHSLAAEEVSLLQDSGQEVWTEPDEGLHGAQWQPEVYCYTSNVHDLWI